MTAVKEGDGAAPTPSVGRGRPPRGSKTYWQLRAAAAGLSQQELALLSGKTASNCSRGLSGGLTGGVPLDLRSLILTWEILSLDQRRYILRAVEEEEGAPVEHLPPTVQAARLALAPTPPLSTSPGETLRDLIEIALLWKDLTQSLRSRILELARTGGGPVEKG